MLNFSLEIAAQQFKSGLHNYLSPDRLKIENMHEVKKATFTVLTKDPIINAESQTTQFLVGQVSQLIPSMKNSRVKNVYHK